MAVSRATLTRAVAVLAAGYLTVGMGYLLVQPGRTTSRVAFVAVVVGLGWVGAAGAVTGRQVPAPVGAVGLFLLGFWQAVGWLFMLPAALAFVLVALALPAPAGGEEDGPERRDGANGGPTPGRRGEARTAPPGREHGVEWLLTRRDAPSPRRR